MSMYISMVVCIDHETTEIEMKLLYTQDIGLIIEIE